jgi:hypothetical protein
MTLCAPRLCACYSPAALADGEGSGVGTTTIGAGTGSVDRLGSIGGTGIDFCGSITGCGGVTLSLRVSLRLSLRLSLRAAGRAVSRMELGSTDCGLWSEGGSDFGLGAAGVATTGVEGG